MKCARGPGVCEDIEVKLGMDAYLRNARVTRARVVAEIFEKRVRVKSHPMMTQVIESSSLSKVSKRPKYRAKQVSLTNYLLEVLEK